MAKKNYGNRSSSKGVKLGEIIARDLRKYASHASVHLASHCQRRTPSIELGISGGNLTDEGLQIVCQALEEVLSPVGNGPHLRLESLDLSWNQLTVRSLANLVRPLALACFEIKDLDLSGNRISVETEDDTLNWNGFLRSFRHNPLLLRINFEGNDFSNPRALEVFNRAYCLFGPSRIDVPESILATTKSSSVLNGMQPDTIADFSCKLADLTLKDHAGNPDSFESESSNSITSPDSTTCGGMNLYRRRGLQAIPYIIFRNTNLSDASALFLSSVLEKHALPQFLNPIVKPMHLTKQLDEYDLQTGCRGVVYLPNEGFSRDARKLLELAERYRPGYNYINDDQPTMTPKEYNGIDCAPRSSLISIRRKLSGSIGQGHARSPSVASSSSERPQYDSCKATAEFDRIKAKIQRNTIKDHGVKGVELWSKSLDFLRLSRFFTSLRQPPTIPLYVVSVSKNEPAAYPAAPTMHQMIAKLHEGLQRQKYEAVVKRFVSGDKVSPVALATWTRFLGSYRHDPRLFRRLPPELWARIIAWATDSHCILSAEQQAHVIRYAMEKSNLKIELQRLGKDSSYQIWTVLDGMRCLTYDMEVQTENQVEDLTGELASDVE